ncbi:hypothetical protein [Pseudomonas sp. ADAK13]|uniref:hypothetical protein n=1 Tax=Pseudomonas sp. ADAK13 TaxID=2730847 RepID=UPI001462D8C5|nr:hypothetical protein [Pseudomonas sp. ADAK13]QJI37118.1 hypothetical protein HKK54_22780 [Pseudomonas sp. ADAK13]
MKLIKQNNARICTVLTLDVPLEDFDHLRSEIHQPSASWIFPGNFKPYGRTLIMEEL